MDSLPYAIQRLVDLAISNPIKYLPVLMERIQSDNTLSMHPRIVDLLLRQLKPPPLPSYLPVAHGIRIYSSLHQDRINMALLGIQGLFIAVTTDLEFAKTLLPSWSIIWRWINYLYHFVPCPGRDNCKEPTPDERTALYLLERLLAAFFDPSCPIGREVLSTKGLLQIIAEMYIRQGVCPPDPDILPKNHLASLSHALQTILESPISNKQELIDFLGSNNAAFAKRMIYAVHQASYGGVSWMECYPYVADVYASLFTHITCVYESFPTKGIVCDVCHALSYFTSLLDPDSEAYEPERQRLAIECVTASLRLLVTYCLVAEDHGWIVKLLRLDFLLSLLKGAHYLDNNDVRIYYELLLREIAIYSVFPVVLKPVGQALESKNILTLERKIPKNKHFYLVWTAWKQNMRNIQEYKEEFILLGRYRRICGYPQCGAAEQAVMYKSCGKCRGIRYCSKLCQKKDWAVHRLICGPDETRCSPLSSQRTLGFIHFLAEKQMRVYKSEIIRRRNEVISQLKAREPLALCINLAETGPPTVYLFSALVQPPVFPSLRYHPLLLPYILIRYGKAQRQCPGDVNLAGELFGWLDRSDS